MLGYDFNHKLHRCERGVVMVFFAILLPLLFGFMGLSLDAGLAYVEKGKVQDIADSAALAGAAKLSANGNNDMNTIKAIKSAVKSYVEANGIALDENDMLLKEADKWDAKETLDKGQDALVAYGVVSVTNSEGVAVPRVRVRITKRVPVIFLSIVDGIAGTIVVSAKAAAEGVGEELEVLAEGPGFISFGSIPSDSLNFYTDKIFSRKGDHSKGYGADIYFSGDFNIDGKLMLSGDYYATKEIDKKSIDLKKDENNKLGAYHNINDTNDTLAQSVKEKVEGLKTECSAIAKSTSKEGYTYINAKTKRYSLNNDYAIIDVADIAKGSKVNNIVIDASNVKGVILNTEGVTFGNVYINGTGYIEGKNNIYTGRLFSTNGLSVYGDGNTYTQLLSDTVNVGLGFNGTANPNQKVPNNWELKMNEPNAFSGTGSSSEGSAGTGSGSTSTITTGNLRLVE